MASLLVMAKNNTHIDPVVDRRGCYKKGDIVVVKPDAYTPSRSECLPSFIVVRCPDVTEVQASNYMNSWEQTVDYTVNSANATTGQYNLTVFGSTTSQSGEAAITKAQVEKFLLNWNCAVDSFANNSVTFTLALWQALQSESFWDKDVTGLDFHLDNYNSSTGQADVTVSNLPNVANAQRIITQKGGLVDSQTADSVTFNINRSVVLTEFKRDVAEKTRTPWCRKQFYLSEGLVDQAINMQDTFDTENVPITTAGQITVTKAELLAAVNDKLSE